MASRTRGEKGMASRTRGEEGVAIRTRGEEGAASRTRGEEGVASRFTAALWVVAGGVGQDHTDRLKEKFDELKQASRRPARHQRDGHFNPRDSDSYFASAENAARVVATVSSARVSPRGGTKEMDQPCLTCMQCHLFGCAKDHTLLPRQAGESWPAAPKR